jgi:hypothetical protein
MCELSGIGENMEPGIIQVTRLEENEDGSANLEIETDREATRFLVEIGLTRLLEMAINKQEGYEFKEDLPEALEGTRQEEARQSTEALSEGNATDPRRS